MVVLAHLQRRWSLSGGEGFGVFAEMKYLFSIAPETRKGGESLKCFSLKKLQPDAEPVVSSQFNAARALMVCNR
jgi:hypothetical protein